MADKLAKNPGEFPKAYDPSQTEDRIYRMWEESGYFNPDNLPDAEKREPYSISMPPPNVTGILHLGHALENSLMDIQVRYQRLKGKRAVIIPGTDHAAVATQARVESELKSRGMANPRQELGREGLLDEIRKFAENHRSIILGQIKKMGTSCDWTRLAYTFDETRSRVVNEIFRRMFEDGLIYRGYRVINWSVEGQSTCSDDELEYEARKTTVHTFKYNKDFPIPVATTRPETKLGDTAVAVNPEDDRYKQYIGQKFTVDVGAKEPLVITIIADKEVDMEYGTGAVGVTPAHSQIDFEMYQNNKEIGIIPVIGKDGRMLEAAGKEYAGLTALEAREKFVAWLKENGLHIEEEETEHNVGTSDRFKDVVEALPMEQWFVDVNKKIPGREKSLKDLMREAVTCGHNGNKNKIIYINPENFHKIYLHWIDNLRDWCISRQIWWGHRIPIWYCDDCKKAFYSAVEPDKCPGCSSSGSLRQEEDTLDTWFSSGTWTFSTLGWPEKTQDMEKYHPTSWMQMGYEILFFWMARMILMTAYAVDDIPFKNVYIHGMLRDKKGRKFSKSLGNGFDPMEVTEKYGTDALRFSLIKGVSAGNDSRFYEEKVEGAKNFVNKLWNVSRFILQSEKDREEAEETLADRWIISRFNVLVKEVSRDMDSCQFSAASEKTYDFLWHDFADWYLETSKVTGGRYLRPILERLLILLHPFMPFVTEEIFQKLPTPDSRLPTHLLMIADWPEADESKINAEAEKSFELIKKIVASIRNARAENKIGPAEIVRAVFVSEDKKRLLKDQQAVIERLARIKMEMGKTGPKGENIKMRITETDVYIPLSGLVGEQKMRKKLKDLEEYAESLEKKLADRSFIEKAPAQIVEKERQKLEEAREKLRKRE